MLFGGRRFIITLLINWRERRNALMYNGPMFFKGSMEVMLVIVLVSFLFVWLFNAYRLRKLKKSKQDARSRKGVTE